MKQKLPPYVVQCFIVSGFDDTESIIEMNVDDDPKNSICVMEDYIDKVKATNPECIGPYQVPSAPFLFPPGHRIRIEKYVRSIQLKYGVRNKRKVVEQKEKTKKQKLETTAVECESETIASVTKEIRKKAIKWGRENCDDLLKENEDFTILVSRDTSNASAIKASIRCLKCGNPQKINRKATGSNSWLLSNWTKHYKLCRKRGKQTSGKQDKLIPCKGLPQFT